MLGLRGEVEVGAQRGDEEQTVMKKAFFLHIVYREIT